MFYYYRLLINTLFNIDPANHYPAYHVLFTAKDDMRIKFDVLSKECAEMKQKVCFQFSNSLIISSFFK